MNVQLLSAIRIVLQELREKTKLTQGSVVTGIFDTKNIAIHIDRIETGTGNISPSTLYLLCEYYNVSLSYVKTKVL